MIQKLLILFLVLTNGTSINAQMFHFGLEAGYTNNQIKAENLVSESKNGFKIGAIVYYQTKNSILLESGISFFQKGGKLLGNIYTHEKITMNEIEAKKMNYLTIPLQLGYKSVFYSPKNRGIYWNWNRRIFFRFWK